MDEKDFILGGLNDHEKSKDSSDMLDDADDFFLGTPKKKSELPMDDTSGSFELTGDGESYSSEPYDGTSSENGEEYSDSEEYSEDEEYPKGEEYSEYEEYFDNVIAGDQEDPEESYDEDQEEEQYYDDPDGDDDGSDDGEEQYYEKADEDAVSEDQDGYYDEDEVPEDDYSSDEPDISLKPSSTNGVTDFSEPRRKKRPQDRSSGKSSSKKKKKKRKSKVNNSIFGALILVTIILTVSLVLAITGIKIGMEYLGVGKSEDDITFNIPENATSDDICEILINNNIIENRTLFKIAMKLQHSPTLFPGDITLHPSMGYSTIIEELSKQRDIRKTVTITFTEGITLLEAANKLEEQSVCTAQDFLFEFNKKQGFAYENQINDSADTFYKMEGFFFPDTYEFYVNDTGYNVSRTIKSNFASKYNESIQNSLSKTDMSLSEIITLASIVQWEANSAEDMPKVASVFLNRLDDPDKFPKLQSDATGNYLTKVINVVGDTASKERYADIYNTYVCNGLPEGPVCNPGLDAILAVLNPEKTKYYYFCNNLKTGKSYFAETLEQHQKNLVKAGLA